METGTKLSRRDFLKLSAAGLVFTAAASTPLYKVFASEGLDPIDIDPISSYDLAKYITESATNAAIKHFGDVPYSWDTGAFCSSYAAELVSHFGLANDVWEGKGTDILFPATGTKLQRDWFKNKNIGVEIGMSFLLKPDNWKNMNPGTLFYLSTKNGQNGYNQPYHVAIYTGWDNKKGPLFTDFAGGMKHGAEKDRTLNDIAVFYPKNALGNYDLRPYDTGDGTAPTELMGYIVDTLTETSKMWRKGGPVLPEVIPFTGFDKYVALTVNTNDGTVGMWQVENGKKPKITNLPIHSSTLPNAFGCIGRRLKEHSGLTKTYHESGLDKDGSNYDGNWGKWHSTKGYPRYTLSPPLFMQVNSTTVINNFGKIGGFTDILLGYPAAIGKDGEVVIPANKDFYSQYTLHEVPEGTLHQDILLRSPLIIEANAKGIPMENPYLSSGCVNLDKETWTKVKEKVNSFLSVKTPVFLIFSVPNFPQTKLMDVDFWLGNDPFGVRNKLWKYDVARDTNPTPILTP